MGNICVRSCTTHPRVEPFGERCLSTARDGNAYYRAAGLSVALAGTPPARPPILQMEPCRVRSTLEGLCAAVPALHQHQVGMRVPPHPSPSIVSTSTNRPFGASGDVPSTDAHPGEEPPSDTCRASHGAGQSSLASVASLNANDASGGKSVPEARTHLDPIIAIDVFRSPSIEPTKPVGPEHLAVVSRRTRYVTRGAPPTLRSRIRAWRTIRPSAPEPTVDSHVPAPPL